MLTAGNTTFTYDDAGSLLTRSDGTSYTWDYRSLLTRRAKTGQSNVDYVSDGNGFRVNRTIGSETTDEYVLDGAESAEHIIGTSTISHVGPGLLFDIDGTSRSVGHIDGQGSTRVTSNGSQQVVTVAVYDAFGNEVYLIGDGRDYGYASNYRYFTDKTTGLQYLKSRYYDPSLGRFISRDPIRYQGGINLYAYVDNNPMMWVDPSGEGKIPGFGCAIACGTALYQIGKYYAIMAGCKAGGLSGDDFWKCVWDQLCAENALSPGQNAGLAATCIACLLSRGWDPPAPKPTPPPSPIIKPGDPGWPGAPTNPGPIIRPGDPGFSLPPNPIKY